MDKLPVLAGMIVIGFILLIIAKKIIKTIFGLIIIAALIFGGIYLYNTYPSEVKDVSSKISQVIGKNTVKDYLRVDKNEKYYVYQEKRDARGRIIYPTGKIFDYPGVDINLDKIVNIAKGDFKDLKKQYYRIDKRGNPIVPEGIAPPRKFIQPILPK